MAYNPQKAENGTFQNMLHSIINQQPRFGTANFISDNVAPSFFPPSLISLAPWGEGMCGPPMSLEWFLEMEIFRTVMENMHPYCPRNKESYHLYVEADGRRGTQMAPCGATSAGNLFHRMILMLVRGLVYRLVMKVPEAVPKRTDGKKA